MVSNASEYSESTLIEQPAIELFTELGWQSANCFHETYGLNSALGRETPSEVVLVNRLRSAIVQIFIVNAILRRTRDLLLPKLISGEVEVKQIEPIVGENKHEPQTKVKV